MAIVSHLLSTPDPGILAVRRWESTFSLDAFLAYSFVSNLLEKKHQVIVSSQDASSP